MRFWVGVSAAFGAGTLIGTAVGILLVEDKLKKEYKEATAQHWRIVQGVQIDSETPELDEQDVIHIRHAPEDGTMMIEGGPIETVKEVEPVEKDVTVRPPQSDNPYHDAVQTTGSGVQVYASYAEISEEEFQDEEDGRAKEQIVMQYHDNTPIFFMGGSEIDDAFERVGGTIVDDVRRAVGEGNPFVWVRNNQTDTDYEVMFDQP